MKSATSDLTASICSPCASAFSLTSAATSRISTAIAAHAADTLCAGVPSARQQSSSAVAETETSDPTARPLTVMEPAAVSSPTADPSTRMVTWSKSAGTSPSSVPSHDTCRLPSPDHAETPFGIGGAVVSPTCVATVRSPAAGPMTVRVPSALS